MDAFKCLYDGVIPTDEIKPGDTLYSQNYFYVLELHADGNIVIMRNRDDNRQVVYESETSEYFLSSLLIKHEEGVIALKTYLGEKVLWRFSPDAGVKVPNRKIGFDQNGHFFTIHPKHPQDHLHKQNINQYFSKHSLMEGEVALTSKKILLQSPNGRFHLASSEDKKEIILVDSHSPNNPLMKFKGTGKFIAGLFFEQGDICLMSDEGSSMGLIYGSHDHFRYLELSDDGALIGRHSEGHVIWSTKRSTLSTGDKTFLAYEDGKFRKHALNILLKEEKLESSNGSYTFEFNREGNGTLRRTIDNYLLYETRTNFPDKQCHLTIKDGNMVIEENSGASAKILWKSFSHPNASKTKICLTLLDDGTLAIQNDLNHATTVNPEVVTFWRKPSFGQMLEEEYIKKGEKIVSSNHKYTLLLEESGNVIIYTNLGKSSNKVTWHTKHKDLDRDIIFESGTSFDGPARLIFKAKVGSLVLEKDTGEEVWRSNYSNKQALRLEFRHGGRLKTIDTDEKPIDLLTLPPSQIHYKTNLYGRTKMISPESRFRLYIRENSKITIEDSHYHGMDIYESAYHLALPYILSANSGKIVYSENGKQVDYDNLSLLDSGIEILFNQNGKTIRRSLPLPHIWAENYQISLGKCMYSPNQRFVLVTEKNRFSIVDTITNTESYSSQVFMNTSVETPTFYVQDGALHFGKSGSEGVSNISFWSSATKQFSYMELADDGILRIYHDNKIVWQSLRIACLAWGSLVWDPRELPMIGNWKKNGPSVKVEFLRKSADGRITLVLSPEARPVISEWCLLNADSLDSALLALASREGVNTKIKSSVHKGIGYWKHGEKLPRGMVNLQQWAIRHNITYVVWTKLGPKHPDKDRKEVPNSEDIINYLKNLKTTAERTRNPIDVLTLARAEEYVRRTPTQIRTRLRKVIEDLLGWTYLPGKSNHED